MPKPFKLENIFVKQNIKSPIPKMIILAVTYLIPMEAVSSFLYAFSIEKRMTASTILTVRIGYSSVTVETIKSYVPYSYVERTLVYKGTSRNTNTFEEKLLIASIPRFLNKYLER